MCPEQNEFNGRRRNPFFSLLRVLINKQLNDDGEQWKCPVTFKVIKSVVVAFAFNLVQTCFAVRNRRAVYVRFFCLSLVASKTHAVDLHLTAQQVDYPSWLFCFSHFFFLVADTKRKKKQRTNLTSNRAVKNSVICVWKKWAFVWPRFELKHELCHFRLFRFCLTETNSVVRKHFHGEPK